MRILVGTLYCNENEFPACVESIRAQTHPTVEHFVLRDLPNGEAHHALYGRFMESADDFDLFIKVDADMVLCRPDLFAKIAETMTSEPEIDDLEIQVMDFFSGGLVWGLHAFRNTVRWPQRLDGLFTDFPSPVPPERHRGDKEVLAPAAFHCPDPSPYQAFHYGLHRALKIVQRDRNERFDMLARDLSEELWTVEQRFRASLDRRLGFAVLGARLYFAGRLENATLDYQNAQGARVFSHYENMSAEEIRDAISSIRSVSADGGAPSPELSICVCTFRRPEGLRRLLESIRNLDSATPSFEVVIVDNDHLQSGEFIVDEFRLHGLPLRYFVEAEQNIARARNRSVREARGTWVAFIDDDEAADPQWLSKLHDQVVASGAAGAVGPNKARFANPAPDWIVEGNFFAHRDLEAGSPLLWWQTSTANAIVARSLLEAETSPFDERYGLTGGEDVDLFDRLLRNGHSLVAAPKAVVYETVPAHRATLRWLLQRHFRNGAIYTNIACHGFAFGERVSSSLECAWIALRSGLSGIALLARSRPEAARRLLASAEHLGRIAGWFGWNIQGYRHAQPES